MSRSTQHFSLSGMKNLRRLLPVLLVTAAAGGAVFVWRYVPGGNSPAAAPSAADSPESRDVVTLSPGKLAAAKIETAVVRRHDLPQIKTVPGRLAYDDRRHVEIRTPVEGVLMEVLVKPGDKVPQGAVLAKLTSREIGEARADILKREAERDVARFWLQQKQTLYDNVRSLTSALKRREPFDEVRRKQSGRLLGDYRSQLFSAYSRYLLAEQQLKNIASLGNNGAIAGKVLLQHQQEWRTAAAELDAACEQAELTTRRERDLAAIKAADANRRLLIARRHLAALLMMPSAPEAARSEKEGGYPAGNKTPTSPSPRSSDSSGHPDETEISSFAIRAPFEGTIERRNFTSMERVRQSDSLFVLADTRHLWVQADIRESEWPAVMLHPGETVQVSVPALADKHLPARIYFIGREVSPGTNAVPLVAVLDNRNGQLRPGLFVRVNLPLQTLRQVLAVPESALWQHNGRSFVFVQEAENRFRPVAVKTGVHSSKWVEISSGLRGGERIVTRGTFLLKSELLLEAEE